MEIFTHLTNGTDSVFHKYDTKEKLKNKFIIRNELLNKFIVFPCYKEYETYFQECPNHEKCFHEVIIGSNLQKIKFDIDIESEISGEIEIGGESTNEIIIANINVIIIANINVIIDSIIEEFDSQYQITLTYEDILVSDSSGIIYKKDVKFWKYSYHIIINNYYVQNNIEAGNFTDLIYQKLPEYIQPYIDLGVNKKLQNFRLLGCAKFTQYPNKLCTLPLRHKKLSELFNSKIKGVKYEDFIIGAISEIEIEKILPEIAKTVNFKNANSKKITIEQNEIDFILNWLDSNNITKDHILRGVIGDIISYNRIGNIENCRICNRIHENDNSLYIQIKKTKNKVSLIEYCHRNSNKFNTLITNLEMPKNLKTTEIAPKISYLQHIITLFTDTLFTDLQDTSYPFDLQKADQKDWQKVGQESISGVETEIYSESVMRPYPIEPNTLCIKGGMGVGKTKALRQYLNEYFSDNIIEHKIVSISNRQTLASGYLKNFPEFSLYSNIKGNIDLDTFPRISIQCESLHRLGKPNPSKVIDLLILDEVESILEQFNSGLHQHFNSTFAIFQWMMATAKKVICIDAHLCERTFNTLKKMRKNEGIYFQYNTFSSESENIYKFTNNQSDWINMMLDYISQDKKIVLPTNSLLEAKTYQKIIEENFPNKRIKLYSSEMLTSEKKEHFSNVDNYWSLLDIVIYTPTCSAGISFELTHFDYVFAHMSDSSCNVETCRQMLMRVRNISSKEYYIYIPPFSSNAGNYLTTTEDIVKALKKKKIEMYQNYNDDSKTEGFQYIQFQYDPLNGDILFYETDYFYLWLENIRINNLSKNNFAKRFIEFTFAYGAKIEVLKSPTQNVETQNVAKYLTSKKEVKQIEAKFISDAPYITKEDALAILDRNQSGEDVDRIQLQSLSKYFVMEYFNIKYEKYITPEFLQIYNNNSVKKVFKYLKKICEYPSVEYGLEEIQKQDICAYSIIGTDIGTSGIESITGDYVNRYNGYNANSTNANYKPSHKEGIEYHNLVKYKYTYTNHFAIQQIIKICGFSFVQVFLIDPYYITFEQFYQNIKSNMGNIEKYIELIGEELMITYDLQKIKKEVNTIEFTKKMCKVINLPLGQFYGIEIKEQKKMYSIGLGKCAKLFEYCTAGAIDDELDATELDATELKQNGCNAVTVFKPKILYNLQN